MLATRDMKGGVLDIPFDVILSWPKANYVNPERRTWMPAFCGSLQAATSVLLFLRLWSRFRAQAKGLGIDDILIILAWISSIGLSTIIIRGTLYYGVDRHQWDVPYHIYPLAAKTGFLCEVAWLFSTTFTKVSILLFYRRMTAGTFNRAWIWAVNAAIVITIFFGVGSLVYLLTLCKPIDAYWNAYNLEYKKKYYCGSQVEMVLVTGSIMAFTDLYSVVLPAALFWNLHLPRRQKIGMYAVFALGFVVTACGAARTYYANWALTAPNLDGTWNSFVALAWSEAECLLGIMCACIPSLKVMFGNFFGATLQKLNVKRNTTSATRATSETGKSLNSCLETSRRNNGSCGDLYDDDIVLSDYGHLDDGAHKEAEGRKSRAGGTADC